MAAGTKLPIRLRKLIGTLLLVPYTVIYALVIMAIAVRVLPDTPSVFAVLFFLAGGAIWLPVAMLIIWWMSRP
ncbi:DUF2842 domain-containing protein [Candidatus Raskinella chloraquaticus]|uniref:DUF2842 domain-containing protein n=1 Tax=Candidatus Raskinella chloraquaticus TaxID=1951219 RepID=UPI0026B5C90F